MEIPKHQVLVYILIPVTIFICCFSIIYKMVESRTEIVDISKTQGTEAEIISESDNNQTGDTEIIEKDGKLFSGSSVKPENGNVKVVDKQFSPSYSTIRTVASGLIIVPVTVHKPESWTVIVEQDYNQYTLQVSEDDFNKVTKNDILWYEDGILYIK